MPSCFVCMNNFPSVFSLCLHLKIVHKLESNDTHGCRENNCMRDFANSKSFRNHLKSKHCFEKKETVDENIAECVEPKNIFSSNSTAFSLPSVSSSSGPSASSSTASLAIISLTLDDFKKLMNDECMLFLSKLYNSSLLPRKYIQELIDFVSEFLSGGFVTILKNFVIDILKMYATEEKHITDVENMFQMLLNPFADYKTEYLRMKMFETSTFFIKPIQYKIGERQKPSSSSDEVVTNFVDVTGQFVPLHKVFTKIFEIPNVYDDIQLYIQQLQDEKLISNIYQSPHFQKIIEKFNNTSLVLPLVMYFDDYECGNALGSHAGIHKLGAVYVSIPTFPPKFSSLLENIFLALLFHSNDRKQFGNAAVFKILLDEFIYLENTGITFFTEKHGFVEIRFVLTVIVGDNLGLHTLLGFTESFNAKFNCRFCKIDKMASRIQNTENKMLIRTVNSYEYDLSLDDISLTGIKEPCIFNKLTYSHAVQNYYADIMHDLYEGVCHYDMLNIIKYILYKAQYLSLETLNNRIESFNFPPKYLNRPPKLSKDFHLKNKISMSASEMLSFVRHFGLIIGDLIPKDDDIWSFYKILRELLDYVNTEYVDDAFFSKLQFCIERHNFLYQKLFQDTLKPKHHHLLHYMHIMSNIGPLKYLSCMRYEAKHRQSKMTADVSCSRVNIVKTLAIKHQLQICHRLINKIGFNNDPVIGPEMVGDKSDILSDYNIHLPPTFSNSFVAKWISISNVKYKCKFVLLVDAKENNTPIFGQIKLILVNKNKEIGFLYEEIQVDDYDNHVCAYKVEQKNDPCINFVNYTDLYEDHKAFLHRMADGKLFITTKLLF